MKVVGLGGSLARVSRSRTALERALGGAQAAGAQTELLDLRELDLPMYNPDLADPTESARHFLDSSHSADAMIWSSPLYQGTISGAFKNALDWLHLIGDRDPPYLHDTVVGLVSAAGGTHGLQAINTMEFSVRALRAWAVPYVVPVAGRVFDSQARILDEQVEGQLDLLGREVVRVAHLFGADDEMDRQAECDRAANAIAAASPA